MKRNKIQSRKGFSLIELMIVLVIIGVLAAAAIPSAANYIKLSEFRENEANAKTVYMAAESTLTWYRNSGQWELFKDEVLLKGEQNNTIPADDKAYGRIYAVTLDNDGNINEDNPVYKLVEKAASDKSLLSAAIAIEIDIDTGQVYSAFYGTKCTKLMYQQGEGQLPENALSISMGDDRSYDNRKEYALGYYSVEDVTNVVSLEPTRLKVTSINLQNSETLALSWSSNSRHDNRDILFDIKIRTEDEVLFSTKLNLGDLEGNGWNNTANMASLTLLNKAEQQIPAGKTWDFPLTYKDGTFTLVLDGMMSAQMMGVLETEKDGLDRTSNVSIVRLSAVTDVLENPQDIYATISASPDYTKMGEDVREYRNSSEVKSNIENTLFDDVTADQASITKYRHLSNIRYMNPDTPMEFVLEESRLNWDSEEIGYYDLQTGARGGKQIPVWKSNVSGEEILDFPTIDILPKDHSLTGNGTRTLLMNLNLGEQSVLSDSQVTALNAARDAGAEEISNTQYLGLFGVVDGKISNIVLKEPKLSLKEEGNTAYAELQGVGLLCGMNSGSLSQITIDSSKDTMDVVLEDRTEADAKDAAVGGIAGILSENASPVDELVIKGDIQVHLPIPKTDVNEHGVGGIFGYGKVKNGLMIQNCDNQANVTGNLYTGGICGQLKNTSDIENESDVVNCSNTGLILCESTDLEGAEDNEEPEDTENPEETENTEETAEGKYFGGIIGYGENIQIQKSVNASGTNQYYKYKIEDKELLNGQYVGGILGYSKKSTIVDCSTKADAYILGSDYVGGILGGVESSNEQVIRCVENAITVNSGYVIGQDYVGGILGCNTAGSTITKCLNNGVAVGYGDYIGGLAGYNEKSAVIDNCASYISDHDNSIFKMIVGWGATGNYTGGMVGYNDGTIKFSADTPASTRTVASIVIGENYVGGVTGFNAENGDISGTEHVRIGGDVYAFGNAAGGVAGVNTSAKLLSQKLSVQPDSVRGKNCVGGIIGANIVDLEEDISIAEFEANNGLGTIKGEAFVGGIMGYHRTYTKNQLVAESGDADITVQKYLTEYTNKKPLLPDLHTSENLLNVPTKVLESENKKILTITRNGNDKDNLVNANNNVSIQAYLYAGGIIGYCEGESHLVLVNCLNKGRLSLPDTGEFPDSQAAKKVGLKTFLSDYLGKYPANDVKQILDEIEKEQPVTMIGGIAGINPENQVIDHCANTGSMSGFTALGGIVGTNAGRVFNCALSDNLGSLSSDGIGGIAGVNLWPLTESVYEYTDCKDIKWNVNAGTIAACTSASGKNIRGKNNVGGIAGYNLYGAVLKDNISQANVSAQGNNVGGQAGVNAGFVYVLEDTNKKRKIESSGGDNVGGIVGLNEPSGSIQVTVVTDKPVIGNGVTIVGDTYVGGIVGLNKGMVKQESGSLICAAKEVRAKSGNAGGIAGRSEGKGSDINNAVNRCEMVAANNGNAGGIVAEAQQGITISNCKSYGKVVSDNGYAGGIVSVNAGTVIDCSVEGDDTIQSTIQSKKVKEIGAVCGKNTSDGIIENSVPTQKVTLSGDASVVGAITGLNEGIVKNITISYMPKISVTGKDLIVGGVAGTNAGSIGEDRTDGTRDINVAIKFTNDLGDTYYLGGVAGENKASVTDSTTGEMKLAGIIRNSTYGATDSVKDVGIGETGRTFGNKQGGCYGGIAGYNGGILSNCTINGVTFEIKGVYTATSISTAEQKEELSSHVGGIAGKNDTGAKIEACYLDNSKQSKITVDNGMAGAIAGYNKGSIQFSGDAVTAAIMGTESAPTENVSNLYSKAKASSMAPDTYHVRWTSGSKIESLKYSDGKSVVDNNSTKLIMLMENNGNLGGITAYNAPAGEVTYCATGDWFLNNKSEAIGVGTGGIIGMNESVQDLSFLVNQAFVGRQTGSEQTNRFAGGIIGNQNVSQSSDWKLSSCINFGTVYGYRTHYSGGILGQWTSAGGTIEHCRNYGNLQTTYAAGYQGASAGIVAQLYHPYEDNEYNIISSSNHGDIYGREGQNTANGANDSAGILGNVTTYGVGSTTANYVKSQHFTIQILDCLNDAGVEIYSNSMASGILGFISCDDHQSGAAIKTSSMNMVLRIERCRNFAKVLKGASYVGGILGDRYGVNVSGTNGKIGFAENTVVRDCYSIVGSNANYSQRNYPMGSLRNGSSITAATSARNYFFADSSITPSNNIIASNRFTISNKKAVYGGTTLFDIVDGKTYDDVADITGDNSTFDVNARESYRALENAKNDGAGMYLPTPEVKAVIDRDSGKLLLTISPTEKSNPFKYTVKVYSNNEEKVSTILYTNNAKISLPKELATSGRALSVQVTAHSMYEESENPVRPSATVTAQITELVKLPNPEIKVELIKNGNSYRYQYRLLNVEEYEQVEGLGGQWAVNINFSDTGDSITLTAEQPTVLRQGYVTIAQQLLVQAVTEAEAYLNSEQISVPAYLPSSYLPQATLSAAYELKGDTLDDLEIKVTLTYNAACDIPPLYRCDLVGKWRDKENVTLASTDILIAAKGSAEGTLANLPEHITEVEDLKLRIWCCEYGLGPVYTYTEVPVEEDGTLSGTANIQILTLDEEENEVWQYQYSPVLADNTFRDYRRITSDIITWLPAPKLQDVDENGIGPRLEPAYNQDTGGLEYTFVWDENIKNGKYKISLTGIDEFDNEVSILNDVEVNGGQNGASYTADAEEWNYKKVELSVTRVGENASNTSNTIREVGFTSRGIYEVSKRLSKPEQPTVKNQDVSELDYVVEWVPIAEDIGTEDDGCGSYLIYLQKYTDDNSKDGNPEMLGEVPAVVGESGLYEAVVDLEAYQGKRVQIYLVAKADTENYVNSSMGVTYEMQVPSRIKLPKILEWIQNWIYDFLNAKTVTEFENGGMDMSIAVGDEDVPQGGSAYLIRGYVYDSLENAEAAIAAVNNQQDITEAVAEPLYSYSQVQMDSAGKDGKNQNIYQHALQGLSSDYAGKWVVFQTRISSSSGQISSNWVTSKAIQLPFVKLDVPVVSTYVERLQQKVNVTTNPDQPKVVQDWQAEHYVCYFDSVRNAESYYITLYPRDAEKSEVTYRIQEEGTVSGNMGVFVQEEEEWQPVAVTSHEDGSYTAVLPKFEREIKGKYTDKVDFYYDTVLETTLKAVPKEDGGFHYTLSVPDITTLITKDGMRLPNTATGVTALTKFRCDVNANDTWNGTTGGSLNYVGSDIIEVNLNE